MTSSDANLQHKLELATQKNEALEQQLQLAMGSNDMLITQLRNAQDAIALLEKQMGAIRQASETQAQLAEKLALQQSADAAPVVLRRGVPDDLEERVLEARVGALRTQA
jgi:hypothetical protein